MKFISFVKHFLFSWKKNIRLKYRKLFSFEIKSNIFSVLRRELSLIRDNIEVMDTKGVSFCRTKVQKHWDLRENSDTMKDIIIVSFDYWVKSNSNTHTKRSDPVLAFVWNDTFVEISTTRLSPKTFVALFLSVFAQLCLLLNSFERTPFS